MNVAIPIALKNKALVPISLTFIRLLLGPFALWWAASGHPRPVFLAILLIGLLSDIFDGVLARKLGVSTPGIRRFDSITDVVFYSFIAASAWILEKGLIWSALPWVAGLILSEVACIGVSLLRFKSFPATHSYLAKVYGLVLFFTFATILCVGGQPWILAVLGVVGLLANVEILLILLLSRRAPVDVLSIVLLQNSK